jgi:hypothetical protein
MVYSLQSKAPEHRPVSGRSMADYQESNSSESGTYRLLPAGCESNSDIYSQQNGALKLDNELDDEVRDINDDEVRDINDVHIAAAVCDHIGVADITQNAKENTVEGALNLIFYYLINVIF